MEVVGRSVGIGGIGLLLLMKSGILTYVNEW